jgi:hypothetical protein
MTQKWSNAGPKPSRDRLAAVAAAVAVRGSQAVNRSL